MLAPSDGRLCVRLVLLETMASHGSKSPSTTPSEGEIIESGSETKATTSKLPLNGTSVDRQTRASAPSAPRSRSPASLSTSRSPRRRRSRTRTGSRSSRSRSRSPFRDYARGHKRRRDDDYYHDDRRYSRQEPSPRQQQHRVGSRYDDRRYERRYPGMRPRPYYDYDREEGYGGGLKYTDDYDRYENKRSRTRSRSPYRESYREVRKPKQYSGDEWQTGREERSVARRFREQGYSTEQLVSERGSIPIVAPVSRQKAETRENQVQQQQASSDSTSRDINGYVFFFQWVLFCSIMLILFPACRMTQCKNSSNQPNQLMNLLSWKLAGNDVKPLGLNTIIARPLLCSCRHYMPEQIIQQRQQQQ